MREYISGLLSPLHSGRRSADMIKCRISRAVPQQDFSFSIVIVRKRNI